MRTGRVLVTALIPLCFVAFASTAGGRIVDGIIAVVNDEPITFSEFRESVAEGLGIPEGDADIYLREEKDRQRILRGLEALIESRLVRQELARIGQPVTEKAVDRAVESVRKNNDMSDAAFREVLAKEGLGLEGYRRRIRWQMERSAVVRAMRLKEVIVTEEETKAYFRENAERFLIGAEVRLETLVLPIPPEDAGSEDDVRLRIAMQQASEYVRSGMSFPEASAMLSSVAPGVTVITSDFVTTEDLLPEIRKEVHLLRTGETSLPIFTETGGHLIRVLERRGGTLPDFTAIKDSLTEELVDRRSEKAFADILVELKKSASIDIRL